MAYFEEELSGAAGFPPESARRPGCSAEVDPSALPHTYALIAFDVETKRQLRAGGDTDPLSGDRLEGGFSTRRPHLKATVRDVFAVVFSRDAHRPSQLTRARRQITRVFRLRPSLPHFPQPAERFQSANQHAARPAFRFSHKIEALVHAVTQIHIGVTRRAEDHRRSFRQAPGRVGGLVALPEISFRLRDRARENTSVQPVNKDLAQQIPSDDRRLAREKPAPQGSAS